MQSSEHPEHPDSMEKRKWCANYHPDKSVFDVQELPDGSQFLNYSAICQKYYPPGPSVFES